MYKFVGTLQWQNFNKNDKTKTFIQLTLKSNGYKNNWSYMLLSPFYACPHLT